ncbi:fibrobacter succinogenes major paralogous domain-containing protein [bacterium]|nr:fibrobacter succinogenes major paralogous domain-containing protein [bacterium]
MKKKLISIMLSVYIAVLSAQAPVVENVRFMQRTDGSLLVDIYYDVTDADSDRVEITILASGDHGETWELPCESLSGDIGSGIMAGPDKHVVWNFYKDNPLTSGSGYRICVSAEDHIATDIDGNRYHTVRIGDQVWMAENLKVTRYRNGDEIPNMKDIGDWSLASIGARCDHNGNSHHSFIYGCLYNWYAATDPRNIAPKGWHVPSDDEWIILCMSLGMSQEEAVDEGEFGEGIGGKLKHTAYWMDPNTGATNESGFSALPAGFRKYNGGFNVLGFQTNFWTSTQRWNSECCAYCRVLHHDHSKIGRYTCNIRDGFSIRCIRDY